MTLKCVTFQNKDPGCINYHSAFMLVGQNTGKVEQGSYLVNNWM